MGLGLGFGLLLSSHLDVAAHVAHAVVDPLVRAANAARVVGVRVAVRVRRISLRLECSGRDKKSAHGEPHHLAGAQSHGVRASAWRLLVPGWARARACGGGVGARRWPWTCRWSSYLAVRARPRAYVDVALTSSDSCKLRCVTRCLHDALQLATITLTTLRHT